MFCVGAGPSGLFAASDHALHSVIIDIVDVTRQGPELPAEVVDSVANALERNARAMIDVDYAGSPLVADYGSNGAAEPHPGQRYPD